MNSKNDNFLSNDSKWRYEIEGLRDILLDCGLTEEWKWDKPCFMFEEKNIAVIQGFKKYCALLFLKGYALRDADNVLIKTGENTAVGRQIRFANIQEVNELKSIIKDYIREAIEIEKNGVSKMFKPAAIPIPEEFQDKLMEMPALKIAFDALTPGRQKGYLIYFSQPKQSKTRESRIEKCLPQILQGKGINDER